MFLLVLLFLLVGVPALEIAAFIHVGARIGVFNTIAFTFLTAILGVILVRWQSLQTLDELRAAMDAGRPPALELVSGALLLLAGMLLLIPGFVTDAAGFLLLVPPLRRAAAALLLRRLLAGADVRFRRAPGGTVIEAEVVEVWEEEPPSGSEGKGGGSNTPPRLGGEGRDTPWRRP
jgi:UPF0716 protein FxsA